MTEKKKRKVKKGDESLIAAELCEKAEVVMSFNELLLIIGAALRPLYRRVAELEATAKDHEKRIRRCVVG